MLMMEEAITTATEEIEAKFLVMEKRENFSILEFYSRKKEIYEPAKSPVDVEKAFNVLLKPRIADRSLINDNNKDKKTSNKESMTIDIKSMTCNNY